ncbi:peptidylprolyl isomerase [soil metagenome]
MIKILKFLKNSSLVFILIQFLTFSPGYAQYNDGSMVVDKIIGKVDNYIVLKSDLERAYLEFLASGEASSGDSKCQILESLMINKLMMAKAEIDSVIVDNEEVDSNLNRRLQAMIAQIGSEERIEEYYGKSIAQFREELRERMKEQLTVQKMQGHITEDIKVTPAEVKKFFIRIPADSLPFFSTEVSIAQIVKVPTVSASQKEIARRKLVELRKRIVEGGEDFEELAREFSEEPGAKNSGGNIGFFPRGQLAPEYESASLRMKPGDISQPVETKFGFHLIQLLERRGNQYNTRHILIRPQFSSTDIKDTENNLDSLRTVISNDSITFEKAAKEYSDDQESAASGGYFLDHTGDSRISVEDIDPVLFFAIDTMQVGTISPPMIFRQDDGTEAVRIIYFKNKMKPHQANLKDDYQKIYAAALNEKRNKALNDWFDKAQQEVFINIDEEYTTCNILQ